MPDVFFDNPPVLQGDEKTQLNQLKNYLFTISNKLNEALMQVSVEQLTAEVQQKVTEAAAGEQRDKTAEYDTLKSMIVKTANIVRTEMDEITTRLETEITAVSDQFGTLQQNLSADIRAGAEGVLQDYHYEERITGLEDDTGTFMRRTNQYIFSGLVDATNLKYGIAIGEGVTGYDANGNPYLIDNAKCATFTMDEMAFYQGTAKLAYFSNNKFYIENGEINKTLKIGDFIWKSMEDNSMALISVRS